MTKLRVHKTHPDIPLPSFATEQSACFDLSFNALGKREYHGFDRRGRAVKRLLVPSGRILVNTFDRILVPTGLILEIPEGFSVRLHPRSGLTLRSGVTLANAEGVIDSDYIEEVYILVTNYADNAYTISHGDRIAQGELARSTAYTIVEIEYKPRVKTSRIGGFGSTGFSRYGAEEDEEDEPIVDDGGETVETTKNISRMAPESRKS